MPFRNGNMPANATLWTDEMITFLKEHFFQLTNKQLADALQLRLTVTRNKCRELGLKRMELEYWSKDQVQFLKDNYKTMGDVEIMEVFMQRWPKTKGWKRGAIRKKRKQMNLERTPAEIDAITARHIAKGGRSYTIEKNSSSRNMHASWVAGLIAWRDPQLKKEVLKHPELIELKRQQILLQRTIKKAKQNA